MTLLPALVFLSLAALSCASTHFVLSELGAVGDGETDNTALFTSVLEKCSKLGGCTIETGRGRILTSPFNLTSNTILRVTTGSALVATDDKHKWALMSPLPSYCQGRDKEGPPYAPFIGGWGVHNITIEGGGEIDGLGAVWWKEFLAGTLQHTRGSLIQFVSSRDIRIGHLALRDSPFWTVHLVYCTNVHIHDVEITAPRTARNTDGINPDSSSNVTIERCTIACGDDAIAIKSGMDECGRAVNLPSNNIVVRDCRLVYGYGLSIGSETSGGVHNVLFHNITCEKGIGNCMRIKSGVPRGGVVSNITYSDILVRGAERAIRISMNHTREPSLPHHTEAELPVFKDINFQNVRGETQLEAMHVECLASSPCHLSFRGVSVHTLGSSAPVSLVGEQQVFAGGNAFSHVLSQDHFPAAPPATGDPVLGGGSVFSHERFPPPPPAPPPPAPL